MSDIGINKDVLQPRSREPIYPRRYARTDRFQEMVLELPHKPQAIPSLTGIRGVGALWVILFHVGEGIPGYAIAPWVADTRIGSNGFRGVDLFFILSGYILMHVHARDFTVLRSAVVWRFAVQRCLRIYPAHLFVLSGILAIVIAFPDYLTWSRAWNATIHTPAYTALSFAQTATLTTRWLVPDYGMWNGVTWSLSVELIAYMTLPFLALMLSRTRSPVVCILVAFGALAVMLLLLIAVGSWDGGNPNRPGLARGVFGFMAGAALCRFVAVARVTMHQAQTASIAALVMLAVFLFIPDLSILTPFSFAILIPSLAYQTGIVNTLLNTRIALFFGKISFPIYLIHATPLMVLEWLLQTGRLADTVFDRTVGLICYGILIVALATAVHTWIERPCQRLGRHFRMPELRPAE